MEWMSIVWYSKGEKSPMYSKDAQLQKVKKHNPKKLSAKELKEFKLWIREDSNNKCQHCHACMIESYHHARYGKYGADKDDRSLNGLCDACHKWMHLSRQNNKEGIWRGADNYFRFQESKIC